MPLIRLTLSIASNLHEGILVPHAFVHVFKLVFALLCRCSKWALHEWKRDIERKREINGDRLYVQHIFCLILCVHSWVVEFSRHRQLDRQTNNSYVLIYFRSHWIQNIGFYMNSFECLKWIFDVKCQRNRNLLSAFSWAFAMIMLNTLNIF